MMSIQGLSDLLLHSSQFWIQSYYAFAPEYLVQLSHFPIIILKFKTFTSGNSYGQTLPSAASYKYLDSTLNLETHFHKAFKKEASRVNLLRKVRSSITCGAAESIYVATVMLVFTYCNLTKLGYSISRKQPIHNIEHRGLSSIASGLKIMNVRTPSIDSYLKRRVCMCVFDCLNGNVCTYVKCMYISEKTPGTDFPRMDFPK